MSKQNLVIGASGQVGEQLVNQLRSQNQDVLGTYWKHQREDMTQLDVRDASSVMNLLKKEKPYVVYIPASLTHVDYVEQHPEEGYAINVTGIQHLVAAANAIDAKLVYFSSDYVFDGSAGPYREDEPANPINEYGRQKLIAEHHISLHAKNFLIIRTTVVFGWESQGKNFVYRLINSLREGRTLRAPHDQIGSPTYAPDLAKATLQLVENEASGVFNVVGTKRASRYDFAVAIAKKFGLNSALIEAATTKDLGQVAQRPLDAGMTINKLHAKIAYKMRPYDKALEEMRKVDGVK